MGNMSQQQHDITVVMAQINPLVGDIPGNCEMVIANAKKAISQCSADIVVFPELTLMAYPPEDLLLRDSVALRIQNAVERLTAANLPTTMVVGLPLVKDGKVFNGALVIQSDKIIGEYAKQCLPNYQVFDDKRYFAPGNTAMEFQCKGTRFAVLICEDVWEEAPSLNVKKLGADCALVLNASPYEKTKAFRRIDVLKKRVEQSGLSFIYVNQVGGQDELVFDGGSLAIDNQGEVKAQAPFFEEGLFPVSLSRSASSITLHSAVKTPIPEALARHYAALVVGVRDYINKNGFKGVVLGLSGGIDSALTLAIAVDALGKDRVEAVMMPYTYTSQMSLTDAEDEAERLGVEYRVISIEPIVTAFTQALEKEFEGYPVDKTEENLQARCRGTLLMAISNKKGYLVLTTGNKSEMAVGYATLYGDMAGGFDVLKDVAKTLVFELANYRNTISPVIPQRVIDRPPSAELAPDQKDEDSLPPYEILDQILALYIEEDQSGEQIIAAGFNRHDVESVLRMVDINEYKRRQSAVGPRITKRGFGRDRRYPITSGWKIGD